MKIGILTQPLQSNYGGLLQAWALQQILLNFGHNPIIINLVWWRGNRPLWYRLLSRIKNEIFECKKRITQTMIDYSDQNVRKFREDRYYGVSPRLESESSFHNFINTQNFDAFVVGSDQVWRPQYSPNLMTYFLDFIKNKDKVKKIAYAASFGVDNWEFSPSQTKEAAALAPLFDLITVRESSGVDLVRKYFDCEATHVLDPTMLLKKEDYLKLVENPTCPLQESNGDLFCYMLDNTQVMGDLISACCSKTNYKPYYCNYKTQLYKLKHGEAIENSVVPPVEQWIKSFDDAKIVITDSFHGCVFSIIFNKPFWVVPNTNRGVARFYSLLKQFGLEDRIVTDTKKIDWTKPTDWQRVNNLRTQLSKKSLSLLSSHLR